MKFLRNFLAPRVGAFISGTVASATMAVGPSVVEAASAAGTAVALFAIDGILEKTRKDKVKVQD